ncbi:hypothetical protein [Rhizobium rhizogenes]|uniref:hypothetical protein n=1 Tax=Rhizobium rhizogenes TaxID=359 RepID=UPI001574418B|nr:hypothetical protein [Rhizobium rhizogenes]NTI33392.1 hypothetical protein [Rhizobium rhizogenes]WEO65091.1 hypothetical protein G6L54_018980 [Rhizobium rhizogenes]
MSRIAFPFLTIGSDAISPGPWMLFEDNREVAVSDSWLASWDSARDVTLRRRIGVDLDIAAKQLRIVSAALRLALVVRTGTGAGNIPRTIVTRSRHDIKPGAEVILLEERVAGHKLSQRLFVETLMLLASPVSDAHALAPSRSGSKVWSDELDLRLEGEEPRFPMEALSFSNRFAGRPEAYAPWYLHWSPGNLHRDFGGSVRLFLNNDRPDLTERLLAGDRATLQVVLADVMIQIISTSVRQTDFEQVAAESDSSSIAGRVTFWIRLAFPGQDISTIRSMIDLRPSFFHAAVLAAADVAANEVGP